MVYGTSNGPLNDIGNCLGPCSIVPKIDSSKGAGARGGRTQGLPRPSGAVRLLGPVTFLVIVLARPLETTQHRST